MGHYGSKTVGKTKQGRLIYMKTKKKFKKKIQTHSIIIVDTDMNMVNHYFSHHSSIQTHVSAVKNKKKKKKFQFLSCSTVILNSNAKLYTRTHQKQALLCVCVCFFFFVFYLKDFRFELSIRNVIGKSFMVLLVLIAL